MNEKVGWKFPNTFLGWKTYSKLVWSLQEKFFKTLKIWKVGPKVSDFSIFLIKPHLKDPNQFTNTIISTFFKLYDYIMLFMAFFPAQWPWFDSWHVSIRVNYYKGEHNHTAAIYHIFMNTCLTISYPGEGAPGAHPLHI